MAIVYCLLRLAFIYIILLSVVNFVYEPIV